MSPARPASKRRSLDSVFDDGPVNQEGQADEEPEPAREKPTAAPPPAAVPEDRAGDMLPAPRTVAAVGPLDKQEQTLLDRSEAAIRGLHLAFWRAGKALQVIRDGRLYRATHRTFAAYVEDRWLISKSQAARLIDAWPIGELLSPIGDTLNESHVRELLPVADTHGEDAVVTVYKTVAEHGKVTAAILHGAVTVLPEDRFDPGEAAERIKAYLAGNPAGQPEKPAPARTPADRAERLLSAWQDAAAKGTFREAAHDDPEAAKRVITTMRRLLDQLEQEVP